MLEQMLRSADSCVHTTQRGVMAQKSCATIDQSQAAQMRIPSASSASLGALPDKNNY